MGFMKLIFESILNKRLSNYELKCELLSQKADTLQTRIHQLENLIAKHQNIINTGTRKDSALREENLQTYYSLPYDYVDALDSAEWFIKEGDNIQYHKIPSLKNQLAKINQSKMYYERQSTLIRRKLFFKVINGGKA